MAREKTSEVRTFRPRGKAAERLDYAGKLGVNISEFINELLESPDAIKHLERKAQKRISELQAVMQAPPR